MNLKTHDSSCLNEVGKQKNFRGLAIIIGILILLAYGAAISIIIENNIVILLIEIFSGLMVVGAAILYIPILKPHNPTGTIMYIIVKTIEGLLIISAAILFIPKISGNGLSEFEIENSRLIIYEIIAYLFGTRFLILGYLFYQSKLIPRTLSIWELIGSSLLVIGTLINTIFGAETIPFYISHLPVILNEIIIAFWLIIKGFDPKSLKY